MLTEVCGSLLSQNCVFRCDFVSEHSVVKRFAQLNLKSSSCFEFLIERLWFVDIQRVFSSSSNWKGKSITSHLFFFFFKKGVVTLKKNKACGEWVRLASFDTKLQCVCVHHLWAKKNNACWPVLQDTIDGKWKVPHLQPSPSPRLFPHC